MRRIALLLVLAVTGCTAETADDHDPSDFDVDPADGKADGLPATFDKDNVIDDATFADATMTVDEVQAFFESSPYHRRSWLASYEVDGESAAQWIVDAASEFQVNPIVLIARLQTETSMVSKTVMPSQRTIDRALGCACPDEGGGHTCNVGYAGFVAQLRCGAFTMRRWFDASAAGTGRWEQDRTGTTLDHVQVTPFDHATAAFYAYTPWVLENTGGTWLAWNVTRKYQRYVAATTALPHAP